MLAYLLLMTNGQAALTRLQNDRYPDLKLGSFADFAARKLPGAAAAQTSSRQSKPGTTPSEEM